MKLPYSYDHTLVNVHIWHVTFVLPKNEERKYGVTMNLAVGAESCEEALSQLREKYPDAKIYAVSHGGILLKPHVAQALV